jgi:serine/threonine-protein kinase
VDCLITDGQRITDEHGKGSSDWYRVRLPDVPGGIAWLPAVRTDDDPQVPVCPE